MTVSGASAMVVYQRKVYLHLLKFFRRLAFCSKPAYQPSSIFKLLIQLSMQITKNKVAAIHYTLRDNEGTIIDSSEGREPLHYLHGAGNLIMGMEEGLEGKGQGDKFSLKIAPEKGYGEKDDSLVQKVPRSAFGDQEVKPGMRFSTNQGGVVTVTNVGLESVTVDGNHPLAGVELNFAVEVIEVRNATSEELSHGHVHGAGGHQH
jgi:FKBP-type peptidyl-prolyl cis-trans isomerase SlyD